MLTHPRRAFLIAAGLTSLASPSGWADAPYWPVKIVAEDDDIVPGIEGDFNQVKGITSAALASDGTILFCAGLAPIDIWNVPWVYTLISVDADGMHPLSDIHDPPPGSPDGWEFYAWPGAIMQSFPGGGGIFRQGVVPPGGDDNDVLSGDYAVSSTGALRLLARQGQVHQAPDLREWSLCARGGEAYNDAGNRVFSWCAKQVGTDGPFLDMLFTDHGEGPELILAPGEQAPDLPAGEVMLHIDRNALAINSHDELLFGGTAWTQEHGTRSVIWIETDGAYRYLFGTGDHVPGYPPNSWCYLIWATNAWNDARVALLTLMTSGPDVPMSEASSICFANAGPPVRRVFRSGEVWDDFEPGRVSNGIYGSALNDANQFLMTADFPTSPGEDERTLWLADIAGRRQLLAVEGRSVPGMLPGETIKTFYDYTLNDNGLVIIAARLEGGPNGKRDAIFFSDETGDTRLLAARWSPIDLAGDGSDVRIVRNVPLFELSENRDDVLNNRNEFVTYLDFEESDRPIFGLYVFTLPITERPDADLDWDCDVDLADLGILLGTFGLTFDDPHFDLRGDVNGDFVIDLSDLGLLLSQWDHVCE